MLMHAWTMCVRMCVCVANGKQQVRSTQNKQLRFAAYMMCEPRRNSRSGDVIEQLTGSRCSAVTTLWYRFLFWRPPLLRITIAPLTWWGEQHKLDGVCCMRFCTTCNACNLHACVRQRCLVCAFIMQFVVLRRCRYVYIHVYSIFICDYVELPLAIAVYLYA